MLSTQNATAPSSGSAKEGKEQFKVDFLTDADKEETLSFLKEFFFKDEPLNRSIGLVESKELEEYSMKSVKENCSFKATNSEGKIVGVYINGIVPKPTPDFVPGTAAAESKDDTFRKILHLIDHVEKNYNIYDHYCDLDKVIEGKILAVNGNYRGAGIAGLLTERTLEYMKEHNIPIMIVMCSSHYSYRVMVKQGFHEVYNVNYSDFKVNGERLFYPDPPHEAARLMVKEVLPVRKAEH